MNEKFVAILEGLDMTPEQLEEAGRGRPRKENSDAAPKVAGKRGRPAKTDDDDAGEGSRDLKMFATIKSGKKATTDSKEVKGASADDIKKLVRDFENQLSVKYANKWDCDEDDIHIHIKDNLGWSGAKAEDQTKDDSGSDSEDDEYEIGKK
jgi:hypothetical protein